MSNNFFWQTLDPYEIVFICKKNLIIDKIYVHIWNIPYLVFVHY